MPPQNMLSLRRRKLFTEIPCVKKCKAVFEGELDIKAGQTLCDASYIKVNRMKIMS
jgi:hypothetical protein